MSVSNVKQKRTVETRLGEIARVRTGKLDANAQRPGGGYPFFTCGEETLEIDHYAFDTEAVLLAGNGNFNVKWYKGKFNAYQRTYVIEPKGVNGKWMFYAVQAALRKITSGHRGSVIRFIRLGDIVESTVALPPLEEQERIVAEIEKQFTRLDAGVASLKRAQTALKRYRASVLKAACEGRLVTTEADLARKENRSYETGEQLLQRILKERREKWNGKSKYKDLVGPKVIELPAVPEGWTWATLSQLTADSVIGLDRGRAQQSASPHGGVPYIKMNNVTSDGRITYDKLSYVPASPDEKKRFVVRDGDVLFNTRNSKELVGKVGLVRNPPPTTIYNNNLMRIRFSEAVSPAFLNLQMTSYEFRRRMELIKKATTNVAAVYAKDLFPLPVALPPFAEQCRILAETERKLTVVDELDAVLSANVQRAARLRQGILHAAFSESLA